MFVHGIGSQRKAQTLLKFAEPLIAWIDARSRTRGGDGAEVVEATLAADDEPAHAYAEISVPGPAANLVSRWLFAESLWATSFPVPSARSVVAWGWGFSWRAGLRVFNYMRTWRRHTILSLVDSGNAMYESSEQAHDRPAGGPQGEPISDSAYRSVQFAIQLHGILIVVTYLISLLALGVALLGAVLAVTGLTLLAVMLAIGTKIPYVKRYVARPAAALAATVGDSYALRNLPIRGAAMRTAITDVLEWTSRRCDYTVVVAHSQGSALAVRAVADAHDVRVDELVTIGAAVRLLSRATGRPVTELFKQRPALRWTNIWAGWDPVSSGPVGDTDAAAKERLEELFSVAERMSAERMRLSVESLAPTGSSRQQPPAAIAKPSVHECQLVGASSALAAESTHSELTIPALPHMEKEERVFNEVGPAEVLVHNRAAFTRDHSTYEENPQFARQLTAIGMAGAGHSLTWSSGAEEEVLARNEVEHVTAVRMLAATRFINGVAALLAATALFNAAFVDRVFDLASLGMKSADDETMGLGDRLNELLGAGSVRFALVALVILLVLHGLASTTWTAWRGREFKRIGPRDWQTQTSRAGFAAAIGASALVVWASIYTLEAPYESDDELFGSIFFVVLLILTVLFRTMYGLRPMPLPQRSPVRS